MLVIIRRDCWTTRPQTTDVVLLFENNWSKGSAGIVVKECFGRDEA